MKPQPPVSGPLRSCASRIQWSRRRKSFRDFDCFLEIGGKSPEDKATLGQSGTVTAGTQNVISGCDEHGVEVDEVAAPVENSVSIQQALQFLAEPPHHSKFGQVDSVLCHAEFRSDIGGGATVDGVLPARLPGGRFKI